MSISKLSERLTSKSDNKFGPEDPDWVQFIYDHKLYLRNRAAHKTFTTLDLFQYRYRPDEFFAQYRGTVNQTWIFLLVNDLRSSTDFTEAITSLWIVNPDDIKNLRRLYEASAQYQQSNAS